MLRIHKAIKGLQMKKAVLFSILITGINLSVFSLTSESWLYFGFEYGNLFDSYSEQGDTVYSYMGSPGLNFGGYRFFNGKNNGVFAHGFFAVPVKGFKEIKNVSKDINFNDYDSPFQVGMIIGPGFRYNFTEDFSFKGAVGVNLLMSWLDYPGYIPTYGDVLYETFRCDGGIGGDIGLKGNITKTFFLNIGSIFTFDFLRFMIMDTSFNKRSMGRIKDFYMFGIRPYITVGFNINQEYE
jgi:hypothetical protein